MQKGPGGHPLAAGNLSSVRSDRTKKSQRNRGGMRVEKYRVEAPHNRVLGRLVP